MRISYKGYTVTIDRDDNAPNPRNSEYRDNLGHMICWHRRYDLGDKYSFAMPYDFLLALAEEVVPVSTLWKKVKGNQIPAIKCYRGKKGVNGCTKTGWYLSFYDNSPRYLSDVSLILNNLKIADLFDLVKEYAVILNLYLYDHSGITMRTTPFSCRFDSGQVGYIYVTKKEIRKEYDSAAKNICEKIKSYLQDEVKEYDHYLRGDCYYVTVSYNGDTLDSCCGFIGDFDDVKDDIINFIGDADSVRDIRNELLPVVKKALENNK